MATKRAEHNKQERQESLREFLSKKCTIQHVIENIQKIESIEVHDEGGEVDYKQLQAAQFLVSKLKTANDQRLKLINKYLPDLKMQEIEHSGSIEQNISKVEIEIVSANAKD